MKYKYKDNIAFAIAKALYDNKREMYYREIKEAVEKLLGHPLSDRQLVKYLEIMVNEKSLNRNDPTGKRGSKVHYSLTKKGIKKYGLRIIGTDTKTLRRKKLYNLLIFFEVYKRRPLLSKRQLSRFLQGIGKSLSQLDNIQEIKTPYLQPHIMYKSISGIEILRMPQKDSQISANKMWYYIVIPGFSAKEFIEYYRLLKKGKEPRPFTSSRIIIPFIVDTPYTEEEVEEAITSLNNSGLIQPIDPIFPGETRYNITDASLRDLIYNIWLVRMLDFELLTRRLIHHRPTEEDKKYLELYFNKKRAKNVILDAYDIRKKRKEEIQQQREAILCLQADRKMLVLNISKNNEKVIRENEILREIVEDICFSPPFNITNSV